MSQGGFTQLFSAPYGFTQLFSAPYGFIQLFSAPYLCQGSCLGPSKRPPRAQEACKDMLGTWVPKKASKGSGSKA